MLKRMFWQVMVPGTAVALAGDDFLGEECVVTAGSALVNNFVGYEGNYDYATN